MICKKWSKRPAHSHDSTPVIFTYLCRTLNNFSHTRGHWSYCATVENKHFIYILYIRSKEQQAKIQTIKCNNKFYDFVFAVFWVYLLIVFTFQKNLRGRNKNDPDAHVWFFNHHHQQHPATTITIIIIPSVRLYITGWPKNEATLTVRSYTRHRLIALTEKISK